VQKNEDFKDYICVIVSTLNQMVNYIPLKHFEFKEVYNLTIDDSEYAKNAQWDKNLKDFFPDINDISFKQSQISNIRAIQRKLNQFKDKEVFWNITGGQRPFLLAINQIAKKKDIICYLEGNKNRLVLLKNNKEKKNIIKDYSLDSFNDMNIEIALKLMGFEIKVTETSERNFLDNYENKKKEKTFYTNFLKKYIDIEDREELLENLIKLNDNYPSEKSTNFDEKLEEYQKERSEATENLKNILEFNDNEYQIFLEEIKPKKKDGKEVKAFGFILEKLAGYKILELAYGKIADMTLGEKINHLRDKDRVDSRHIDEFDIALLTKNGKFMIFECKSGGMDGDVAKSTKYSTYAVSGAYGLPILITPLLKNEIIAIRKKSTISGSFKENSKYLKNDTYKNIRQAINSAIRAGLEVWGLDDIEDNLKKYIELYKEEN
jgi:hypothetical protein